jgi:hypothetical protein
VLWIILILAVAIAYEAFDATSLCAAPTPRDTLRREESPVDLPAAHFARVRSRNLPRAVNIRDV